MIELLLCTLIWGASFVAQKLGADHFGPFTINCYRNLLAGVFLVLCLKVRDRRLRALRAECPLPAEGNCKNLSWVHFREMHVRRTGRIRFFLRISRKCAYWKARLCNCLSGQTTDCPAEQSERARIRRVLLGGALSGLCVFAAEVSQQVGIESTLPGVSAFLTANYVLLVPVFGIFLGRRAGLPVWGGVLLALAGTFLICFGVEDLRRETLDLGTGEAWTLLCAALFAVQILVVDHFARDCDMLCFSLVQMSVAGLVSLPFVFLPSELARTSWAAFIKGIPALIWLGIISSGIAYTLQNLGQAKVPAAFASIIMSLEGVFAAIFGWLILGDQMTVRQLTGCALVFSAVLFSQLLPLRRKQ